MATQEIQRVLVSRRRIARRVQALASEIAASYRGRELVMVPLLTGSMIFLADLMRCLPLKMRVDVLAVSSYAGQMTRSREPRILYPKKLQVAGKHVLIVDDILDSGRTLAAVRAILRRQRAASVRACVLLRKHTALRLGMRADFIGFDIPDEFVVGYGMDYNHFYRNLPEIAVLHPSVIATGPHGGNSHSRIAPS